MALFYLVTIRWRLERWRAQTMISVAARFRDARRHRRLWHYFAYIHASAVTFIGGRLFGICT